MELKPAQYDGALKMLNAAGEALTHAQASTKRREEQSVMRRRIEEVESFLKKAKRELRLA